jgi:hypothetical protein
MFQSFRIRCVGGSLAWLTLLTAGWCLGDDATERTITLSDGKITLIAPAGWQRKEPRVKIIEAEFATAPVEGDEDEGRLTVMGAGGSVQANLDRWVGQFEQTERNQVEKQQIANQEVHLVDLIGTFKDQRGPFAPATLKKDYRMLGAIIVTPKNGQYFLKYYGPKKTVAENEAKFKELVRSLKVTE